MNDFFFNNLSSQSKYKAYTHRLRNVSKLVKQMTCDNFFLGVLDLERAFFKNIAVWVFLPGVVSVGAAKSLSQSFKYGY